MRTFTNPLDTIRVASPCPANWDEMFGDERKRFCGSCKLNVYNLSNMTRREAEDLLINSEGRLCVRFFRRADGTVLTKNCPVGWQTVKRRVSRVVTAAFSMIAGIMTGIFGFNVLNRTQAVTMGSRVTMGDVGPGFEIQGGISPARDYVDIEPGSYVVGEAVTEQPVKRATKVKRK